MEFNRKVEEYTVEVRSTVKSIIHLLALIQSILTYCVCIMSLRLEIILQEVSLCVFSLSDPCVSSFSKCYLLDNNMTVIIVKQPLLLFTHTSLACQSFSA